MALVAQAPVVEAQLWVQGDIRDPLGIWGARVGVTGDASGGSILVQAEVAAEKAGAFIYTCYSQTVAQLTGTMTATRVKSRLLANWPDLSALAGVQGYSTGFNVGFDGDSDFAAGFTMAVDHIMKPNDRFILLFDPRPTVGAYNISELELGANVDLATYAFEWYGYYWDRSVMNAPGGLRHPGSS